MILGYYIEDEYLKKDFEIFDSITSEKYYVKMAKAWAISIALIKYYDQTLDYLKNTNMDKWTYNKAIQKAIESYRITEKQKQELRVLKR
jgi:3-methyladenine DNA glycosylase AlkD